MTSPVKAAAQRFKKYTVQPKGIWAVLGRFLQVDPSRSTGVPLNPVFRNPPPETSDLGAYDDPVTVPAADLAENPYWKRDVRRSYPMLSTVSQSDVVGLLTVGSKAQPRDDVLQIGEAGTKQLVAVTEEGHKGGLAVLFAKETEGKHAIGNVLGKDGSPPMPVNLSQVTAREGPTAKRYELVDEQSYPSSYPCRSFS